MFSLLLNNFFFLKWSSNNLITIIINEILTKNLFMLAWFSPISLISSIFSFKVFFFSRSKYSIWLKGVCSKNFQFIKNFIIDCDMDCILIYVFHINNISCHTGNMNCFYNNLNSYLC